MSELEIKAVEIAKLQLAPGDIVLLKVNEILAADQVDHLRKMMLPLLPNDVRCLVLSRGMDVSVLTKAEVERMADTGIANGCD